MTEIVDLIEIKPVFELSEFDISFLLEESLLEGQRHIRRLTDDYKSGKNEFRKPGECLFVALSGHKTVGICGLNRDERSDLTFGRIRRLYVIKSHRRCGIGRRLVEGVIREAKGKFEKLILRTDNPDAGKFYESVGFKTTIEIPNATHIRNIE